MGALSRCDRVWDARSDRFGNRKRCSPIHDLVERFASGLLREPAGDLRLVR